MRTLYRVTTAALAFGILPHTGAAFELTSQDISPRSPILEQFAFSGFGCTGDNVSPELAWSDAPSGTKSFALMVHDADAQTGGAGFWHWVVVDIPAAATNLKQGAGTSEGRDLPAGAKQIATDFGVPGWGGPCPPVEDDAHQYDFTLYALPVDQLELPEGATASLVGFVVNSMALGSTRLSAEYDR